MDRRAFLAMAAAGGFTAIPAVVRAQQAGKVHRIGFLSLHSGLTSTTEAFRQGLRELGYVEGRNLIIEYAGQPRGCRSWRRSCAEGQSAAAAAPAIGRQGATSTIPSSAARRIPRQRPRRSLGRPGQCHGPDRTVHRPRRQAAPADARVV
jgi:putative ABC transport system substrate-binding protein